MDKRFQCKWGIIDEEYLMRTAHDGKMKEKSKWEKWEKFFFHTFF